MPADTCNWNVYSPALLTENLVSNVVGSSIITPASSPITLHRTDSEPEEEPEAPERENHLGNQFTDADSETLPDETEISVTP